MTYREWIAATVSRFHVTPANIDANVDLILTNQMQLIPDADSDVNITVAKFALCSEFAAFIPLSDIREGDISISWNFEAIIMWYLFTCKELGITPVNMPKITDKSNRW